MNLRWIIKWYKGGPYLEKGGRLADILAAIQVLDTYQFAARTLDKWEKRLGRKPQSAENWETIFCAHPEFFT